MRLFLWFSNSVPILQLKLNFIFSYQKPYELDTLLSSITLMGCYFYAIFSMIAAGVILPAMETKTMMVFAQSALLFIQVTFQGMIIAESGRRICSTRSQQIAKPGRQLITFLLFANITLWILDTFMTHNWVTQEIQLNFYGLLAWGVISRISLPLMIFYRFHSCVVLVEIWKNTYRTKEALWGRLGPTVSQVSSMFQKVNFFVTIRNDYFSAILHVS